MCRLSIKCIVYFAKEYIVFPNQTKQQQIQHSFLESGDLPMVLGCIDNLFMFKNWKHLYLFEIAGSVYEVKWGSFERDSINVFIDINQAIVYLKRMQRRDRQ